MCLVFFICSHVGFTRWKSVFIFSMVYFAFCATVFSAIIVCLRSSEPPFGLTLSFLKLIKYFAFLHSFVLMPFNIFVNINIPFYKINTQWKRFCYSLSRWPGYSLITPTAGATKGTPLHSVLRVVDGLLPRHTAIQAHYRMAHGTCGQEPLLHRRGKES